jgi:hypothetical protein
VRGGVWGGAAEAPPQHSFLTPWTSTKRALGRGSGGLPPDARAIDTISPRKPPIFRVMTWGGEGVWGRGAQAPSPSTPTLNEANIVSG